MIDWLKNLTRRIRPKHRTLRFVCRKCGTRFRKQFRPGLSSSRTVCKKCGSKRVRLATVEGKN